MLPLYKPAHYLLLLLWSLPSLLHASQMPNQEVIESQGRNVQGIEPHSPMVQRQASLLHKAMRERQPLETIQFLVKNLNPPLNALDETNQTELDYAQPNGEVYQYLEKQGAYRAIDLQLFHVAVNGTWETLQKLVEQGANPSLCNPQGQTLSQIAYQAKNYQVASRLQQQETDHIASVDKGNFRLDTTTPEDNSVRLWDLRTGKFFTFKAHTSPVQAVSFSPNGKMLPHASQDRTMRFPNRQNDHTPSSFHGDTPHVVDVRFSPQGHTLASASEDQSLRLWDPIPMDQPRQSQAPSYQNRGQPKAAAIPGRPRRPQRNRISPRPGLQWAVPS